MLQTFAGKVAVLSGMTRACLPLPAGATRRLVQNRVRLHCLKNRQKRHPDSIRVSGKKVSARHKGAEEFGRWQAEAWRVIRSGSCSSGPGSRLMLQPRAGCTRTLATQALLPV